MSILLIYINLFTKVVKQFQDSDEEPPSILKVVKKKEETNKTKTGPKELSKEVKNESKEETAASAKEPETVLEMFAANDQAAAAVHLDESKLPKWLFKYLVFRFILLDRTGKTL